MLTRSFTIAGMAALGMTLGVHGASAQAAGTADATPGDAVSTEAQLLKEAGDIAFSAQQLQPIALASLPAKIDLSTLPAGDAPGIGVSGTARTLRDLDPGQIPGTARTLGGIARSGLPGAAGSAGGQPASLPSAAQNRSRGRGHR